LAGDQSLATPATEPRTRSAGRLWADRSHRRRRAR